MVLSTTIYATHSCLWKFAMQATAVLLYLGCLGASHTQPMAAQVPGTSPPTVLGTSCMQPTATKHPPPHCHSLSTWYFLTYGTGP